MNVTDVQIMPVAPRDGLIAFASCVLNGEYRVDSIAVFTKLSGGYRLVYPTKKVGDRQFCYHHPLTPEASRAVEEAVFHKVEALFDH